MSSAPDDPALDEFSSSSHFQQLLGNRDTTGASLRVAVRAAPTGIGGAPVRLPSCASALYGSDVVKQALAESVARLLLPLSRPFDPLASPGAVQWPQYAEPQRDVPGPSFYGSAPVPQPVPLSVPLHRGSEQLLRTYAPASHSHWQHPASQQPTVYVQQLAPFGESAPLPLASTVSRVGNYRLDPTCLAPVSGTDLKPATGGGGAGEYELPAKSGNAGKARGHSALAGAASASLPKPKLGPSTVLRVVLDQAQYSFNVPPCRRDKPASGLAASGTTSGSGDRAPLAGQSANLSLWHLDFVDPDSTTWTCMLDDHHVQQLVQSYSKVLVPPHWKDTFDSSAPQFSTEDASNFITLVKPVLRVSLGGCCTLPEADSVKLTPEELRKFEEVISIALARVHATQSQQLLEVRVGTSSVHPWEVSDAEAPEFPDQEPLSSRGTNTATATPSGTPTHPAESSSLPASGRAGARMPATGESTQAANAGTNSRALPISTAPPASEQWKWVKVVDPESECELRLKLWTQSCDAVKTSAVAHSHSRNMTPLLARILSRGPNNSSVDKHPRQSLLLPTAAPLLPLVAHVEIGSAAYSDASGVGPRSSTPAAGASTSAVVPKLHLPTGAQQALPVVVAAQPAALQLQHAQAGAASVAVAANQRPSARLSSALNSSLGATGATGSTTNQLTSKANQRVQIPLDMSSQVLQLPACFAASGKHALAGAAGEAHVHHRDLASGMPTTGSTFGTSTRAFDADAALQAPLQHTPSPSRIASATVSAAAAAAAPVATLFQFPLGAPQPEVRRPTSRGSSPVAASATPQPQPALSYTRALAPTTTAQRQDSTLVALPVSSFGFEAVTAASATGHATGSSGAGVQDGAGPVHTGGVKGVNIASKAHLSRQLLLSSKASGLKDLLAFVPATSSTIPGVSGAPALTPAAVKAPAPVAVASVASSSTARAVTPLPLKRVSAVNKYSGWEVEVTDVNADELHQSVSQLSSRLSTSPVATGNSEDMFQVEGSGAGGDNAAFPTVAEGAISGSEGQASGAGPGAVGGRSAGSGAQAKRLPVVVHDPPAASVDSEANGRESLLLEGWRASPASVPETPQAADGAAANSLSLIPMGPAAARHHDASSVPVPNGQHPIGTVSQDGSVRVLVFAGTQLQAPLPVRSQPRSRPAPSAAAVRAHRSHLQAASAQTVATTGRAQAQGPSPLPAAGKHTLSTASLSSLSQHSAVFAGSRPISPTRAVSPAASGHYRNHSGSGVVPLHAVLAALESSQLGAVGSVRAAGAGGGVTHKVQPPSPAPAPAPAPATDTGTTVARSGMLPVSGSVPLLSTAAYRDAVLARTATGGVGAGVATRSVASSLAAYSSGLDFSVNKPFDRSRLDKMATVLTQRATSFMPPLYFD